ncbi:MAG: 50S ribosomal protein L23 [cyanobacterium endosymbiont of Epithemia adnata isolate EadnSB Bon19]|uniref:50S ribosomal protein L23 n=1 Tax=cyanobacterium endosymbiont of Epithemia turgida TaxID=718217 RepID=UPI0004D0EF16|nr:50S ribosomal protein L23 [cyanobacterium endosymbiont of Epithemia turgida]BAP17347.1 50S ribosomal protein L23 [cyanobacterium endosymbiont of Epithemia turgida isolate EtSB Lake Yunoko]
MTDYDPRNLADLILKPIVTEKATLLLEDNKYVFEVALKSNKSQIKAAIESLFKVSVLKVNTARPPRKKKRVGKFVGYKPLYKRATVTLQEGDSIVLFPDV